MPGICALKLPIPCARYAQPQTIKTKLQDGKKDGVEALQPLYGIRKKKGQL